MNIILNFIFLCSSNIEGYFLNRDTNVLLCYENIFLGPMISFAIGLK